MAKMTLLEMTQSVLNAMDSDDVNAIDDTTESGQVATIIKESYFDLISQRDWPFLRTTFSLTGLGDVNNPTKMELDEDYSKILWVKYNKKDVTYLDPKVFQDMIDQRVELANVVDANGFVINQDPIYYTTFDDETVVFDSIDLTTENTLQTSNSLCYGVLVPTWTHSDTFVPLLPAKMFPTLVAEAKSNAFLNLKQQANAKEERKAQRGRNIFQNEAWRNDEGEPKWNRKINYGRR
jgi:hypothetical protein